MRRGKKEISNKGRTKLKYLDPFVQKIIMDIVIGSYNNTFIKMTS